MGRFCPTILAIKFLTGDKTGSVILYSRSIKRFFLLMGIHETNALISRISSAMSNNNLTILYNSIICLPIPMKGRLLYPGEYSSALELFLEISHYLNIVRSYHEYAGGYLLDLSVHSINSAA